MQFEYYITDALRALGMAWSKDFRKMPRYYDLTNEKKPKQQKDIDPGEQVLGLIGLIRAKERPR